MKNNHSTSEIVFKRWPLMLLAILTLHQTACQREPEISRDTLITNEIDKRIRQFILARKTECYNTTMELAIHQTDSLVKLNAVKYIEDDLVRPALPIKPPKEIKPAPKDTIQNRPFLKDSIQVKQVEAKDSIH